MNLLKCAFHLIFVLIFCINISPTKPLSRFVFVKHSLPYVFITYIRFSYYCLIILIYNQIILGQCLECHTTTTKMCQQCATILCDACFDKSHKNFVVFQSHMLKNIGEYFCVNYLSI